MWPVHNFLPNHLDVTNSHLTEPFLPILILTLVSNVIAFQIRFNADDRLQPTCVLTSIEYDLVCCADCELQTDI